MKKCVSYISRQVSWHVFAVNALENAPLLMWQEALNIVETKNTKTCIVNSLQVDRIKCPLAHFSPNWATSVPNEHSLEPWTFLECGVQGCCLFGGSWGSVLITWSLEGMEDWRPELHWALRWMLSFWTVISHSKRESCFPRTHLTNGPLLNYGI